AALMSGQVDWIEAPAPDALEPIKARGNTIYTNVQPHIWPWQFSLTEGSPWADKRVRQAANLCVDREGMKGMLGGLMAPAQGVVAKSSPWWGTPTFDIKYDPDASRKLMQEAGFSESKPVKVKVQISASGSGQMQPLPMNEYIQQNLKECFFDVQFDVVEWNTLFNSWRLGAKDASAHGAQATNVSAATMDPFFAMVRFASSKALPPVSNNWGYVIDDTFDDYIRQARTSFDPAQRDAALAKLHTRMVDEAVFLYVAHDVGPRAISNKVKGVVQPQSWFIDIATMSKE
ncbi:MAG: ABC transporter substrate-binding protein, partial [Advenella sp.]